MTDAVAHVYTLYFIAGTITNKNIDIMLTVRHSGLAVLLVIWTQTASCQACCNETLTSPTGAIVYPDGPDPTASCWWLISAPATYSILLTVSYMNKECGGDQVMVYAGNSDEAPAVAEFCDLPEDSFFGLSSNQLYITFNNIEFNPYVSFLLNYSFYAGNCTRHLTTSPGVIESPGYPGLYPNKLSCSWLIEAPAGHTILLDIFNVSTECGYDYVKIYDGYDSRNASNIYQYCHLNERLLLASWSNFFYITFTTDLTETGVGFLMEYSFYNCNAVLTEPTGLITSPGYPHRYPNHFQCSWLIVADPGSRIVLTLEYVNTECYYDYVYVYDGANRDALLMGEFCETNNTVIESTSNYFYIRFHTDYSVTYKGFKAAYSFTDMPIDVAL